MKCSGLWEMKQNKTTENKICHVYIENRRMPKMLKISILIMLQYA